jgi:hypothetical protein
MEMFIWVVDVGLILLAVASLIRSVKERRQAYGGRMILVHQPCEWRKKRLSKNNTHSTIRGSS